MPRGRNRASSGDDRATKPDIVARGRGRGRSSAVEESGDTRQTILRAAEHLFMEHGYRAVSTRQIATASGLTQPALYHHFADKQDLYVAMLREKLDITRAALERIVSRGGSVEERLRQVAAYLPTTQGNMGQMFHDIEREVSPEARRSLEASFVASIIAPLASLFAEGQHQGLLHAPDRGGLDPVTSAYLLAGMIRDMPTASSRQSERAPHIAREQLSPATLVHVLLHGLAAPPSSTPGAGDDA